MSSGNTGTNPVNNAAQSLITTIAGLLGPLSPFAKAVVPATAGLVGSAVTMAFTGQFAWPNLEILGLGLVGAVVTYAIPNLEKKSSGTGGPSASAPVTSLPTSSTPPKAA